MTVDEVRYDVHGPAAVVTIDRQHRRNAIDGPTAGALVAALERFEADDGLRVMVLTGAGEAFCAGADLTAIDSLAPRAAGPDGPLGFTRRLATKPTIAAVDGWAVAGGLELALWCDLRVASPRSRFGCLERRWGVPLIDGGTWRLPRVVGLGRALDLILTGRLVDAAEAERIGLVTTVADDPLASALALAGALAAYPQETLLSDRASVYAGWGLEREEALATEMRLGLEVVDVGRRGAQRFAGGEGRGGTPA
ncbi:MAG TPA: crotonase/enoyl-CoA hydratase family protein [Mycobacteriales bacterium]|nr:crotonase/enoyl-CoA hydratase family protein [Mycobacteriales bacterium]